MNQFSPILATVPEACDMLRIRTTKIYELMAEGKIKTVKIGTRRRVLVSSIYDFIRSLNERDECLELAQTGNSELSA